MSDTFHRQLEALEAEARRTAERASAEVERIRNAPVSPEQARAFAAKRKARFWQMPTWLWVPSVVLLVALVALAVFASLA
jgi:hypothetical protein